MKLSHNLTRRIEQCMLIAAAIVAFFPIYWMFNMSIKSRGEALTLTLEIPPAHLAENYLALFGVKIGEAGFAYVGSNLDLYFINTVIICLSAAAISVLIGSLAAYSLNRFKIRGANSIAFWILSIRMTPPIAAVIPYFMMFRALSLLNTYVGIILVYTTFNLPFVVWMMMGYFEEIPRELEESAMVDGCSRLQSYLKIIMPLARPGLVATILFSLIVSWNEFLLALVLTGPNTRTLMVGIQTFMFASSMGSYQWTQIGAAGVFSALPIVIIGVLVQKHLIRGMTLGAVKG